MITPGAITERVLPDGRVLSVIPLMFDRARLCIANAADAEDSYDDGW